MSSEAPLFLSHTKNSALPIHCSFFFFFLTRTGPWHPVKGEDPKSICSIPWVTQAAAKFGSAQL